MKNFCIKFFITLIAAFLITSCKTKDNPSVSLDELIEHPSWTKNSSIYEVNIRQYTPSGTFSEFREHLPRLQEMGIDILWLMPIHPIGVEKRKGELGSYYSISDYKAVNPNFGTMQEFKNLVTDVHGRGMKLILDWVPNHTAWDHPWVKEHPEYYMKDSLGNITYEADWTDIAQLNYENQELWDKMIEEMKFWIEEANIDGFRVDHAGHDIPIDFWMRAIPEIDNVKEDLFWLAEWNTPEMHPWFDATYSWEYFHLTTDVAAGRKAISEIDRYINKEDSQFPAHAYRMKFTTNHDENSWNGTDEELFGNNFLNFAVLASTVDGIPLIYSGQETGLNERLEFFKKDTIRWDDYEYQEFYTTLFDLKDRNEALWNGQYGGRYERVYISDDEKIYAYKRIKGDEEVKVILNFSESDYSYKPDGSFLRTRYRNVFSGDEPVFNNGLLSIPAYSYKVFEKQ